MKLFSLPRVQHTLKVALIVGVAASVSLTTLAEARPSLNPARWFAGSEEQNTLKQAQLKADEAQRRAIEAQKAAEEAEKAAERARRAADELRLQSSQSTRQEIKETAEDTPKPQTKQEKDHKKAQKTEVAQRKPEKADEAKSGGWHLLNIFDKAADVKKEEANPAPATKSHKNSEALASSAEQSVKQQVAVMETEKGNIAFELYPDLAPQTVANFVELVNSGFYNKYNMKFHRVVPGFVVQTGDPTGTGAGGSKKTIPLEVKNKLSHNAKGIVAMARGFDPNSATSQFYITLAPQPSLDGKYAIFGKVISGLSVLDKIEVGDMLYGIRLVDSDSVARDPVEKKGFFSSLF
jgi:peptidyl-prolyl cis-trans isomerase B (cyclophilin B)